MPISREFFNRITKWFENNADTLNRSEDFVPRMKNTRVGIPVRSSADLFALDLLNLSDDYISVVEDCTKLSEYNPIFKPIIEKLVRTTAKPETSVELVKDKDGSIGTKSEQAKEILENMLSRIGWEKHKNQLIKNMLNEGGISWEVVLNTKEEVRFLEYRPHHLVVSNKNVQGEFVNVQNAFTQYTVEGQPLASYAAWQLIDMPYVASAFNDRGVPHMQAARKSLSNVGSMLKGMMQKWARSGTTIEHFNMKEGTWNEVEQFKDQNAEALEASPDNLLRQFFSAGDVTVERLTADGGAASATSDVNSMEYLLEVIFLATGVSKEIMGFKSHVVIKDMAAVAFANFYQVLTYIQGKVFEALKKVCDFQLLLMGILPEEVSYKLKGGTWKVDVPPLIQPWMTEVTDQEGKSIFSVNDVRKQAGIQESPEEEHALIGSVRFNVKNSDAESPEEVGAENIEKVASVRALEKPTKVSNGR